MQLSTFFCVWIVFNKYFCARLNKINYLSVGVWKIYVLIKEQYFWKFFHFKCFKIGRKYEKQWKWRKFKNLDGQHTKKLNKRETVRLMKYLWKKEQTSHYRKSALNARVYRKKETLIERNSSRINYRIEKSLEIREKFRSSRKR